MLRKPIVNDLDVGVFVEKYILGFDVSVRHLHFLVQITDARNDLHHPVFDGGFIEPLPLSQDLVELATFDEGHDKIQPALVLEKVLHVSEAWMIHGQHRLNLIFSSFDLTIFKHLVFPQDLDGEWHVLVVVLVDEEYFSESSTTDL